MGREMEFGVEEHVQRPWGKGERMWLEHKTGEDGGCQTVQMNSAN